MPYEKIAETLEGWLGDDEAAYRALRNVPWIATEKIHGANFCLVSDGVEVRAARRKAYLAPDEDFFGHRALLRRIAPQVIRAAAGVIERDARVAFVFVYGELFGGRYPHPKVRAEPEVQAVQTGCWYSPKIEFCAFDLGVMHRGKNERAYVDHDEAARVFAGAGIFHAKPFARGSYEELIQVPLGFESTIPAALGLPPLPAGNKAEGLVLKPARSVSVPRTEGSIRPVIKRKIPEFAEDARYHGATKWVASPAPAPGASAGALSWLRDETSALLTGTRLAAAVSKVGRVRPGDTKRAGEVLSLLLEDIDAELSTRAPALLQSLAPRDAQALRRHIETEARALIEIHLDVTPP
ncbi:RNA ligase, phage-associated [Minicystis rosea]|nr:RNA ligase, phage-associated [Minicystis rosea]